MKRHETILTLKAPSKIAADDNCFFYFYLSKKIRLDVSCESSAKQRINMKYLALFYQKNNENIFKAVVIGALRVKWRLVKSLYFLTL